MLCLTVIRVFASFLTLGLLCLNSLSGQTPNPFGLNDHFSATLIISSNKRPTLNEKIFEQNGRLRIEGTFKGVTMSSLVLPDVGECYQIDDEKERVLTIPFKAAPFKEQMLCTVQTGIVEDLGPEETEGMACEKLMVILTSGEKGTFILWRNAKTKGPVKIEPGDHSFSILWTNYEIATQPSSLFTLPKGFKMMKSPVR